MADYKTKAHNVYFNASFTPTSDLRFTSTVGYNKSEAKYDEIEMPDVSSITVNSAGEPDLTHQDFTFTEMDSYSDLSYELLTFDFSAQYKVSPTVTLSVDGKYADLQDNASFVYGDESGSLYMIRTGVRLHF